MVKQKGGFKEAYTNQGTLKPEFAVGDKKNHSLWTAYFKKHLLASSINTANSKNSLHTILVDKLPAPTGEGNRYLYVIDMQNDFIDKVYDNDDGNKQLGKFAVGEGASVIPGILSHANDAINSDAYKAVIFSRDYHPEDHCSFGAGHKNGGSFPSHCVQGTKGAQLINEIKTGVDFTNPKVKVIFKGIHPDADSFSAMSYGKARQASSGSKCTGCTDTDACSNVTGGWELPDAPVEYNGPITYGTSVPSSTEVKTPPTEVSGLPSRTLTVLPRVQNLRSEGSSISYPVVTAKDFTPVKYEPAFPDGSVIEVCGLAGDYCVRDTAIALATKYVNCTVVVLNDLVRYPFVPMWLPCKMHTNVEGRPLESHMEHLDYFLNAEKNKGFNYYLFDQTGTLMTPTEIQTKFSSVDELKAAITAEAPNFGPVYSHFLSDPRDIILDYKKSNVRIMLNPLLTTGGRRRSYTARRVRKRASTKKRSYAKSRT